MLETLESAFRQTYKEIELIVSDDCSTDNTFELCQQWVEEHKERFVRTLCTQTPHNGGIVWNYNHALQHAQGEWIKYIAGDDILCDNCIDILVHNIKPNIYIYFSSFYCYDNFLTHLCQHVLPNKPWYKQLQFVLRTLPIMHGSTLFIEHKHLIQLGGFDSRFPLSEDFPITLRYLTNKYQIGINHIPIVIWRVHNNNTSFTNSTFKNNVQKSTLYFTRKYCWRFGLLFHQLHHFNNIYISENYLKGGIYRIIGYFLRSVDIVYWKRRIFPVSTLTFLQTINISTLIENHKYDPK